MSWSRQWGGRAGLLAVAFFTIKGLAWLGLAVVAVIGATGILAPGEGTEAGQPA